MRTMTRPTRDARETESTQEREGLRPGDDARQPGGRSSDGALYDLIELMFFAYRAFVEDADRILAGDGFGRAHHRVVYFVARRPGMTIAELLDILRITKQSLNRVLKELVDRGYIVNRSGEHDRRQRLLYVTAQGDALVRRIAAVQSARFERIFAQMDGDAKANATAFLKAMSDAPHDLSSLDLDDGRTVPAALATSVLL